MQSRSAKLIARIAGLFYLLVVMSGMFSLAYIPSKLFISDKPVATFQNIISHESMFRLGIVSSVVCYLSFLFLVIYLYQLLRHVNENYAKLMVLLVVISIPISFLNLQNQFSILSLINGKSFVADFSPDQIQSQVLFSLAQYNNGIHMVDIFWGLWLLPFGYLVFKSGMLPKILGILLMLGCVGYIIEFIGDTLNPHFSKTALASYIRIPGSIGELGMCLWLLMMGAKDDSTAPLLSVPATS